MIYVIEFDQETDSEGVTTLYYGVLLATSNTALYELKITHASDKTSSSKPIIAVDVLGAYQNYGDNTLIEQRIKYTNKYFAVAYWS